MRGSRPGRVDKMREDFARYFPVRAEMAINATRPTWREFWQSPNFGSENIFIQGCLGTTAAFVEATSMVAGGDTTTLIPPAWWR